MNDHPLLNKQIGHYQIIELLGSGAMGDVFKALDTYLETFRALKFVRFTAAERSIVMQQFLNEARTQAKLSHPNIAALLSIEFDEEFIFFVQEYVEGKSLDILLQEALPQQYRLILLLQIASALEAAHSVGIIHRDIKPSNIIVSEDGTAKVTDFGLAKTLDQSTQTTADIVKGTARYLAPEAFLGRELNRATDIWSFGVLAFEVLTGEHPFQGTSFEAIGYQTINVPHPSLPERCESEFPGISHLIDSCLQKQPEDRINHGGVLFHELARIGEAAGISDPSLSRLSEYSRRRRRLRAWRNALILSGVVGIGLSIALMLPTRTLRFDLEIPASAGEQSPTLDPTGHRVAYLSDLGGPNLQILDLNSRSRDPRPIPIPGDLELRRAKWSPTGEWIAIAGSSGLFLVDPQTATFQQVVDYSTQHPAWSSDGRYLLFRRSAGRRAGESCLKRAGPLPAPDDPSWPVIPVSDIDYQDISVLDRQVNLYHPMYLLNDSHIAFMADRRGMNLGIWCMTANGDSLSLLVDGSQCPQDLEWDRTHGEIMYYSRLGPDVYRLRVSETGESLSRPKPLHINSYLDDFELHPDTGNLVVLTSSWLADIWSLPIGSNPQPARKIISGFQDTYTPAMSRDSNTLLFAALTCDAGVRLKSCNIPGGKPADLFTENLLIRTEWLPVPHPNEDRYIVYQAFSQESFELYLYDTVLGQHTRLTTDPTDEFIQEWDPFWSLDGRYLYYVALRLNPVEYELRRIQLELAPGAISIIGERVITRGGILAAPMPDPTDRVLLYQVSDGNDSYLEIYELATSRRHTLGPGTMPTPSPDYRDVYFLRGDAIYRIGDWGTSVSGSAPAEFVTSLPPQAVPDGLRRTFTVGRRAIYISLTEHRAGALMFRY